MMKRFSKYFLRGVFTLLPAGLTVFLLISFLKWTENVARDVFSGPAAHFYFPGLGLLLGVLIILLTGIFTSVPFSQSVLTTLELPFKNVPIVKSIYSAVKSLSDYFSPEHTVDQQVVVVRMPGFDAEFVGLVTRRHLNDLPREFTKEDRVAVFVPLSYQIGGLTMFIPRAWIKKTDMRVEEAMRSALTAWMPTRADTDGD